MPWLKPSVISALWDARDGAQMVLPVGERGPEPLLALYHTSCLPEARRMLASGRRRLLAIAPAVKTVEVPLDAFREVDPGLKSIVNINTPDELLESRDQAAKADAGTGPRVSVIEVGSRAVRGMPAERPITVFLNDDEIATMQSTPENLSDLGVGFLLAEGFITDRDGLESVDVDHKRGLVYVRTREVAPPDVAERRRYVTSGCGKGITFASVGHARGIEPIASDAKIGSELIYDLMGALARSAAAYRDTGGMHSCGLTRARPRGRGQAQRSRQAVRSGLARSRGNTRRCPAHDGAHKLRDGRQGREGEGADRGLADRRDRSRGGDSRARGPHARRIRPRG